MQRRTEYATRFLCYGKIRCWEVYLTEDGSGVCRFTRQQAAYLYARALNKR